MRKPIYCIGGATVDYKFKVLSAINLQSSNPATSSRTFGGVARNVAENLSYWTDHVHLQCVVANDDDGKNLLNYLQILGVHIDSSLILSTGKTARYFSLLNEQGEMYIAAIDMEIYNHLHSFQFSQHWNKWEKESIIFADTNLSTTILADLITFAKNKQSKLCIDPVSIAKTLHLPKNLHGVFLIKPNQLEASALSQMTIDSIQDAFQAAHKILNAGVENVVITLGNQGYIFANHDQQKHVAHESIYSLVDANGAGDAFCAGLVLGLHHELSIADACKMGANAATLTMQSMKTVCQIPLSKLYENIASKKMLITQ